MGISIKEPCHEDWDKMTSTEKGAHCKRCAMEVIDFTNKSPFEIKSILAQEFSPEGRLCGRITNYQLDQLNDDFFQWKNDREAFRSVWIFSLVAVFGLTLFSCQNTLSKEMINKLNTDTIALMEVRDTNNVEVAEIDSSLVSPSDSFPAISIDIWKPYEITYVGIMPYTDYWLKQPWITCEITMGSVIQSGFVTIEQEAEQFLKSEVRNVPDTPKTISPFVPSPPKEKGADPSSIVGIDPEGGKQFDAFIYPNPIETSSRLYINTRESIDLNITIYSIDNQTIVQSGTSSLLEGHYKLDLKLYALNSGDFKLHLKTNKQVSNLDFLV